MLGDDRPVDLAHVVGSVVLFGVLSLLLRQLAAIDRFHVDGSSLLVGAVATHPLPAVVLALGVVVLFVGRRDRLAIPWRELDHGSTLRLIAFAPLLLLTWQGAAYDRNFLTGNWNTADRLLLVALAVGCVARPAFLLLFAAQSRIISGQFEPLFHTIAAQNIDALLVVALVAIATIHLWFVVTGRNRTEPVVLLLTAAIASHFFVPGKSKVDLDWARTTDLANLPLSAYVAGWLGAGDGSWARWLSSLIDPVNRPLLYGVQVFELGSLIAVVHDRLFRLWLVPVVLFHVALFAMTGFWFLSWVVVELVLVWVLLSRRLQPWVAANATPARGLLAAAMVLVGAHTLFRPPGLAWLDAPVSYGYRFEAVTDRGDAVTVPIAAFSPFEQEVAFGRLGLGPTEPLSAGYGAVATGAEFDALAAVETVADLDALTLAGDPDHVRASQDFVVAWFDQLNASGPPPWWTILGPPDHFWTSSPAPTLAAGDHLERLEVYRLTALHRDAASIIERELVLRIDAGPDGHGTVTYSASAG